MEFLLPFRTEDSNLPPIQAGFDRREILPGLDFDMPFVDNEFSPQSLSSTARQQIVPALDFDEDRRLDGDTLPQGNAAPLGGNSLCHLPCQQWQFGRPQLSQPRQIPDIRQGLGRRQVQQDIVALADFIKGQVRLVAFRESLWYFEAPCWHPLVGRKGLARLVRELQKFKLDTCLGKRDVTAILNRLEIDPALQDEAELIHPKHCLNFLDGTLNLRTGEFYDHCPDDYFISYLALNYSDVCDAMEIDSGKIFEEFVSTISGGNPAIRQQLLELTIQVLTDCALKYFYVLLGPSHTGKSQFGRFLEELIGRDWVTSVRSINDFGQRFTTGYTEGMRLVTCLDLPNITLTGDAISELKRLVGDDDTKGEKKHLGPTSIYQKPLLIFASNYPIKVNRIQEETAFLNRMITIPFSNPCPEDEMIPQLYKELLCESPYIIGQAICAYKNLAGRNFAATQSEVSSGFQPEEGNQAIRDIAYFIQNTCIANPSYESTTENLYLSYQQYAEKCGLKQVNLTIFSRSFLKAAALAEVSVEKVKRTNGSDSRGYAGIKVIDNWEN